MSLSSKLLSSPYLALIWLFPKKETGEKKLLIVVSCYIEYPVLDSSVWASNIYLDVKICIAGHI